MTAWRRPRALRTGDRVAVVAPASPFDRDNFERGIAELAALGFEPVFDDSVFARQLYVAGPPALRAAALTRAWTDPSIAGILAVRGGYGSAQLLPLLDPAVFRAHAKPFIGYSDLTSIQVWLSQAVGLVSFQGPMLEGRLSRGAEGYSRDVFLRALTLAAPLGELPVPDLECLVTGIAAGPLCGGTLTQLAASLGTPYAFDPPRGCILLLEDVAERPYRLDRLVTQLAQAGILARAAGLVLGTFPRCDEPGGEPTAREALGAMFAEFAGPVVFGLPVGHVDGPALTVPLGARVRVAAGQTSRLTVEEPGVE